MLFFANFWNGLAEDVTVTPVLERGTATENNP